MPNTDCKYVENLSSKAKEQIKCIYSNVDCLTNKIDELSLYLNKHQIDVAFITETNPKNNTNTGDDNRNKNLNIIIEGYKCEECPSGRGVCIFYKDNIEIFRHENIDSIFKPSIFCKIVLNKDVFFNAGLIYRSPNCSREECEQINNQIATASKKLNQPEDNLLILGDLNYPEINWGNLNCSTRDTHTAHGFLDTVVDNQLNQLIDRPTHYRTTQNPTLIDLVLVKEPELVSEIVYDAPFGKSHHQTLLLSLNIKNNTQDVCTERYLFDKGSYDEMRASVDKVKWDELLKEEADVDCWMDEIANVIIEAKNTYVPKRKLSSSKNKRKFHAPITLLDKVRLKRTAFKKYKKYPTLQNYNEYARARNQVKWEVRKAKKSKERSIAQSMKKNPKLFFRYVNSKIKSREGVSNLRKDDGNLTENDKEKTEVLNNFFQSVFTSEDKSNIPKFESKTNNLLSIIKVTENDIFNSLKNLNITKSQGPDLIHPRILKELAKQLSYPLKKLFDKTMKEGNLPKKWKTQEIRPIFKKGNRSDAGNYRPVSLTSIICKIFEGYVRDALFKHLLNNDLLSNHQFGFCPGRSCSLQLLVTLQQWFQFLDNNISMDAVYMDFRKAFDSVPHERLITKLHGYGIRGEMLNWVRDFLSDREQYVCINDEKSDTLPVTSGVPQGSVLGPTLFIYFINDLPLVTKLPMEIFADDTKAFNKSENTTDKLKLQNAIDAMVQWTKLWLIEFNKLKCKVLHAGKHNPNFEYHIGSGTDKTTLEVTTNEKDLGVHIDPLLTFENHINETIKKATNMSNLIMRAITYKSADIMIPLFKALVRPTLEYANVVWFPAKRKDINALENVQRRYTKCIAGMKETPYEDRLKSLNLPSLEYRRIRGDMIEAFKITHNIYDYRVTENLLKMDKKTTRNHGYKLEKQRVNSSQYQNFFTNRIVNVWNNLPYEVVNADTTNCFKNKLDKHMKQFIFTTNLTLYNHIA